MNQIIIGDCREELVKLDTESVDVCITSPPYWKQRRYPHPDQIGQEKTVQEYVNNLTDVFNKVHRVLRRDGLLWLVIDDTMRKRQLCGVPWRVAFALQESGWKLRQEIIWFKTNPTPQSVKDRTTRAHEYIFMFSKSDKYYYNRDAIRTPYADSTVPRMLRGVSDHHKNVNGAPGQSPHTMSKPRMNMRDVYYGEATKDFTGAGAQNASDTKRRVLASLLKYSGANKKSVWIVTKKSFKGNHFATFPPDLIEPCVLASKPGAIILDPFGGRGTVARVARLHNRHAITIEQAVEYKTMIEEYSDVQPLISL